jgi:hypothetical protein
MEATFDVNEETLEVLRLEAERSGVSMSALVESALQMALPQGLFNRHNTEPSPEPVRKPLPPLPTWKAEFLVDISNKEELYRVLDEAEDSHLRRLYGYKPDSASKERE